MDDEKTQKEWLKSSFVGVDTLLQEKIKEFCNLTDGKEKIQFEGLREEIISSTKTNKLEDAKTITKEDGTNETINEKNMLWNFTLLDSSTNRSYGNAIFSAKRRVIIGKTQGERIEINEDFEIEPLKAKSAFIPICTENIFQKVFNPMPNSLREWDKQDAETYLENIKTVLADFLDLKKEGE